MGRPVGAPPGVGQAYAVLGQVCGMLGRPDEAEAAFQTSFSMLDEQGNPYETALTWIAFAHFQGTRAGEIVHAQARAACDRAVAVFDGLGAHLDAERARELRQSL